MPKAIVRLVNHCSDCPNFRYINATYGYTCRLDEEHKMIVPAELTEDKNILEYMVRNYPDVFPEWCLLDDAILDAEKTFDWDQYNKARTGSL